jgi:hypothetical protein
MNAYKRLLPGRSAQYQGISMPPGFPKDDACLIFGERNTTFLIIAALRLLE